MQIRSSWYKVRSIPLNKYWRLASDESRVSCLASCFYIAVQLNDENILGISVGQFQAVLNGGSIVTGHLRSCAYSLSLDLISGIPSQDVCAHNLINDRNISRSVMHRNSTPSNSPNSRIICTSVAQEISTPRQRLTGGNSRRP